MVTSPLSDAAGKVRERRYKDAPVGCGLETSFGHASHYIFVFVADVTLVPPVQQQQQNKSYILPPQYNRGLLALIFSQCVFEGPCAHILRRKLSSGCPVRARVASFTLYLILLCLLKDFGRFLHVTGQDFSKYAPHPFPKTRTINAPRGPLTCDSLSNAVRLKRVGIGAGNARQWRPGRRCSVGSYRSAGGMCQARRGEFLSPV